MGVVADFSVQAAAALVGVFAAVLLALWVERRRAAAQERRQEEGRARRLDEVRDLIMSSVVKNTSESKRLGNLLRQDDDPYLFQIAFEYAVWEAARQEFIQLATLDERVLFSRFFDQTRRLSRLLDFHRQVRAQHEVSQSQVDVGDRALFEGITKRLQDVAEDTRLEGVLIVTDYGKPLHKRLIGMRVEPTSPSAAGSP